MGRVGNGDAGIANAEAVRQKTTSAYGDASFFVAGISDRDSTGFEFGSDQVTLERGRVYGQSEGQRHRDREGQLRFTDSR